MIEPTERADRPDRPRRNPRNPRPSRPWNPSKRVVVAGVTIETSHYLDACRRNKVRLVGLVGAASELRSQLVRDTGVPTYDDLDALVGSYRGVDARRAAVDLLVIAEERAAPTFELLKQVEELGWPVLCHKPFAELAVVFRRTLAEASEQGRTLMVVDPYPLAMRSARNITASPAFGKPQEVTASMVCGSDHQWWISYAGSMWRLLLAPLLKGLAFFPDEDPLNVAANVADDEPWAQLEFRGGRLLTAEVRVDPDRFSDLNTITVTGTGSELEVAGLGVLWRPDVGSQWIAGDPCLPLRGVADEVVARALARLDGGPSWEDDVVRRVAIIDALHRSHKHGGISVALP